MSAFKRVAFVIKFLEIRLRFVAILVVTALVVGYWDHVQNYYERWRRHENAASSSSSQPAEEHSITEYFCPMHTFVVRETPGKCPVCGMTLISRKKGEKSELPEGVISRVQASPDRVVEAGVKVEPITYKALSRTIRVYGEVVPDETKQTRIIARFEGRMDELLVRSTGEKIAEGQPLARIYSPKFLAASEEYLQALKAEKNIASDSKNSDELRRRASDLATLARQRLHLSGLSEKQLKELAENGKAEHAITLYSPFSGVVLERNALQGDMVTDGTSLFTLADLSSVWIQAHILESDLGAITEGMPVRISAVAYPGREFFGTVQFIYPTVNADNRTAGVRIVLPNPKMEIRPGMSINAEFVAPIGRFEKIDETAAKQPLPRQKEIHTDGFYCPMHPEVVSNRPGVCPKCDMKLVPKPAASPENEVWTEGYTCPMHPDRFQEEGGACPWCGCGMSLSRYRRERSLAVPEQAVIDTGTRKVIYVESSPGVFDAKEVSLGARAGGFYPVLAGLKLTDRIVGQGAFLIDAENRLNPQ